MEPKYQNGSVGLIRETGFDYDGAVYAVVLQQPDLISKTGLSRAEGFTSGLNQSQIQGYFFKYSYEGRSSGLWAIIVGNFVPMEG